MPLPDKLSVLTKQNSLWATASPARRSTKPHAINIQDLVPENILSGLNLALFMLALLLLFFYITSSNISAADTYKIGVLNDQLAKLNENHSALIAQQASGEDLDVITVFAKNQNMVPAGNISYIFNDGSVALKP